MNKALKLIRQFHRLSQKEMADKLDVSAAYICEIEKGRKNVSLKLLESYSDVFKIPLSSLIYFIEKTEGGNEKAPISRKALKMLEWLEIASIQK